MAIADYGGAVLPYGTKPPIGAYNYTIAPKPEETPKVNYVRPSDVYKDNQNFDAKVLSGTKFGDLALDGSEFRSAGTRIPLTDEQLSSWDWTTTIPQKATDLTFQINGNYYTFHPSNILEKGFVADGKQFYNRDVLKNLDRVYEQGQPVSLKGVGWYDDFLKKNDLSTEGILLPAGELNFSVGLGGNWRIAEIGQVSDRIRFNEITGIGKVGDQYVYTANVDPVDATSAYGYYDATGGKGEWSKEKGGLVGSLSRAIAKVPFGAEAIGLATGNPMVYAAASGLRGGATGEDPLKVGLQTGATILAADLASDIFSGPSDPVPGEVVGGTPGVSEVYPVDMTVGGTVTPLAPISVATGVPATELAYPAIGVEQTYTPAPGSLQEALPGFGVQTQASTPPFTAAPGSFAAATAPGATLAGYGLLSQVASPTISLSDAFRTARTASSLLGGAEQPQQQQFPNQQLPAMQASGVDTLMLPQLTAGVPNVAGLLSTRQYPRMTFDLYTGLPSLLG